MKFAAFRLFAFAAALTALPLATSSAQGISADAEEFRRLAGEVADLRDANSAQQRRIAQLQKEVDSLRSALREANDRSTTKMGDFVTREDLKKILDRVQEVDQKRESDRKLILEEFEKLGRTIASAPAPAAERKPREKPVVKDTEPPVAPIEGTFYPHKVQEGESLGEIVTQYNAALAKEGRPRITLAQVRAANPKLNPNRILVGQEILLPVPDKK